MKLPTFFKIYYVALCQLFLIDQEYLSSLVSMSLILASLYLNGIILRNKLQKYDYRFKFVIDISIVFAIIFSYRVSILNRAKDIKTIDYSLGVLQQKLNIELKCAKCLE